MGSDEEVGQFISGDIAGDGLIYLKEKGKNTKFDFATTTNTGAEGCAAAFPLCFSVEAV